MRWKGGKGRGGEGEGGERGGGQRGGEGKERGESREVELVSHLAPVFSPEVA